MSGFLLVRPGSEAGIETLDTDEVWFDFRDLKLELEESKSNQVAVDDPEKEIKATAQTIIDFISGYDIAVIEQAKSFSGVGSFNRFKRFVALKGMD